MLTCYLVSLFKIKGKKEYSRTFNDLGIEKLDKNYQVFLSTLNAVILQNKKSLLQKLENYEIEGWLINILKKIEMESISI